MENDYKFGEITVMWLTARELLKNKSLEEASELLDSLLIKLSKLTLHNIKKIDGVSMDMWKDRVWIEIEKNFGLPEIDEDIQRSSFI